MDINKIATEIADTYRSWHMNSPEHDRNELYVLVSEVVKENCDE